MAAKIIPMKHNPVSLYSSKSFNSQARNEFKRDVEQYHDTKPPKDNFYERKGGFQFGYSRLVAANGKGEFLFEGVDRRILLYNIESHGLNPETNLTTLQLQQPPNTYHLLYTVFNSKFAAYIKTSYRYEAYVVDLSKKCLHCCNIYNKNGVFVPETTECNPNSCAIETIDGQFRLAFASQLNPNKIVFFDNDDKIMIWTHGEGCKEVKLKNTRNVSYMSEHTANANGVQRHWFAFTSDQTYIVDLNNTSDRIIMPAVRVSAWIAKKSKIALVSGAKLTVYDLEHKSWSVKLALPDPISALLFSPSSTVLFLATAKHIHAYIWETALLIASMPHDITDMVVRMHLALEQVLVLSTHRVSYYKKIRTKLDM
eukprot:TRINITY_DN6831_c0_g1_i1.p1 TRINITY_DN6831_c0_g1~~TRINITY_DN6831_c0_g1_i1.p1  ORF type:complete len:383 (+),score=49.67 TRINITY_DN6831_c0_g1_i1:44-1150(+)